MNNWQCRPFKACTGEPEVERRFSNHVCVCSVKNGEGQRVNTLGICEVMRGASPRSREESLRRRQSIGSSW
jgi:hypothetical protein